MRSKWEGGGGIGSPSLPCSPSHLQPFLFLFCAPWIHVPSAERKGLPCGPFCLMLLTNFALFFFLEQVLHNFSQQSGAWHQCVYFMNNCSNQYVLMYAISVFEVGECLT